ncbi:MAG: type II secretion system protein M [Burkholderiaceae bacterium]|nr:type II secretion system protein M [Burkholderiaceae bacterium]
MLERLVQSWRAIAPRERRLVTLAGGVLVLALIYLVLIEPAWQGRRNLQRELPVLRQQLSQMIALSAEARQLATVSPIAGEGVQALRGSIEGSLKAAGLEPMLQKLELNGELIDLRFKGIAHASWLNWMESAQRETRMRVVDLSITREADNGIVSVRMVLEAPKREAG